MLPTEPTKTNPAAGVVPTPAPAAPWRVARVEAQPGMKLQVTFGDGTTGEVRLRRFLESARVVGTIFEALREPGVFAEARVELGAVTWPNGADLAPDTMYDAIRAEGHWTAEP